MWRGGGNKPNSLSVKLTMSGWSGLALLHFNSNRKRSSSSNYTNATSFPHHYLKRVYFLSFLLPAQLKPNLSFPGFEIKFTVFRFRNWFLSHRGWSSRIRTWGILWRKWYGMYSYARLCLFWWLFSCSVPTVLLNTEFCLLYEREYKSISNDRLKQNCGLLF